MGILLRTICLITWMSRPIWPFELLEARLQFGSNEVVKLLKPAAEIIMNKSGKLIIGPPQKVAQNLPLFSWFFFLWRQTIWFTLGDDTSLHLLVELKSSNACAHCKSLERGSKLEELVPALRAHLNSPSPSLSLWACRLSHGRVWRKGKRRKDEMGRQNWLG